MNISDQTNEEKKKNWNRFFIIRFSIFYVAAAAADLHIWIDVQASEFKETDRNNNNEIKTTFWCVASKK